MFPHKNFKKSNEAQDIDDYLIIVYNFFAHLVKEISITKYGSDKELIPTFSPYEIYQYSDTKLKHLPKDALLYSKEPVYYNDVNIDRRNHKEDGLNTATLTAAQIVTLKKIMPQT